MIKTMNLMKKHILLGGMLLCAAAFTSCNEDFDDWASPQSNAQGEDAAAYAVDFTGSGIDIDMNDPECPEIIKLLTVSTDNPDIEKIVVKSITIGGVKVPYTNEEGENDYYANSIQIDSIGQEVLQSRKHEKRQLTVDVEASVILKTGEAAPITGSVIQNDTPVEVPELDPNGYFLLGAIVGTDWDPNMPLFLEETDEEGVYEAIIETTGNENWYKFYGGSSYNEFGETTWDDVNAVQMGCAENGDTKSPNFITFTGEKAPITGEEVAVQTPMIEGAGHWKITLDMNRLVYSVVPASANMYIIGAINGTTWSQSFPLYDPDFSGKFQGFYYIDGEFKFKPNGGDDWSNDLEYDGEGKIADNGGSNCPAPEAGFYVVDVDMNEMTYALTKIEFIDMVGGVEGSEADWSAGPHMTYNTTKQCWEADVTLTGEFKFRGNGNWDNADGNFGGSLDNIINGSNQNVNPPVTGPAHVELYLSCNGNSYVEITAVE